MANKCRVETTSYGSGDRINSLTDASSDGDTPHSEFVGGMTAGEIGKGHAMGHADYLAKVKSMEIYTGTKYSGSSSGNSGMSGIKDALSIVKNFIG